MSALSATLVLAATLLPSGPGEAISPSTCLLCGERGGADLVVNLLLFAPLGWTLRRLGIPVASVILLGASLSVGVEMLQLIVPGRSPTWRDLGLNLAGTAIGAAAAAVPLRHLRPGPAERAAWVLATLIPASVACAGWLLTPNSAASALFGHFAPRFGGTEHWNGVVLVAAVGDDSLRNGPLANATRVVSGLAARHSIKLEASIASAPHGFAPMLSVTDGRSAELLLLAHEGQDLVFRERRNASLLRLHEPELRFEDLLAGIAAGDTFRLDISPDRTHACAQLTLREESRVKCTAPLTTASAWRLLLGSRSLPSSAEQGAGALMLAAMFLPLATLSTSIRRRRRSLPLLFAVLSVGLIGPAVGLHPLRTAELVAILVGAVLGYAWSRTAPRGDWRDARQGGR